MAKRIPVNNSVESSIDTNKLKDMLITYEEIRKKIKNNEDISVYHNFINESNEYIAQQIGLQDDDIGIKFNTYLDYFAYLEVKTALILKQLVVKELGRKLVFYEEYLKAKADREQVNALNQILIPKFWSYDVNDAQDKRYRNRIFYPDNVGKTWLTKPDRNGFDGRVEEIVKNEKLIPFYITKIFGDTSEWRTVTFNATIKNLSQTFTPTWERQNFFGRSEGLDFYTDTTRNISVGFDLIPDSIEDLPYIYKKLDWLTKMSYPEYDNEGNFKNFPIVRLKIGDLLSWDGNRGVAGHFTDFSHDFDPTETTWELIEGLRVPQKIDISFNFDVIHDEIPSSNKDYHIFHTRNIKDDEDEKEMDKELKQSMLNRKEEIQSFMDDRVKETQGKFWDEVRRLVLSFPAKLAQTTDSAIRDRIKTQTNLLIKEFKNEIQ